MNPRTWRTSITVAVIASLLIGVAALVVSIVDWNKVDDAKSSFDAALKVAAVNNAVPATTMAAPTNGATVSGVVNLDARPISSSVKSVDFVANGGTAHNVNVGAGSPDSHRVDLTLEVHEPTQRDIPDFERGLQR